MVYPQPGMRPFIGALGGRVDAGEKIELIGVTFEEYLDLVAKDNYRDMEIALKLLKLALCGLINP